MKKKVKFNIIKNCILILVCFITCIGDIGEVYAANVDAGLDGGGSSGTGSGGSTNNPKYYKTINFNGNGGNLNQSISCWHFSGNNTCHLQKTLSTPSRNGYMFVGWSTSSACPCDGSDRHYIYGNVNLAYGQTYHACWVPNCYYCSTDHSLGHTWNNNLNGTPCGYENKGTFVLDKDFPMHCNACGSGGGNSYTPPTPPEACYVCKNNSVIKTVRSWKNNADADANCSAGYVKDEKITSKDKCVTETVPINYCKVNTLTNKNLDCNASKSLDSICDKRTIVVDNVGYADVKIEQHGYISNVLNPTKTYAGGGFSFGVTYTNTIKWSYVGDKPNDTLHKAIVDKMNNKIKDYNSFISSINISEISFDGKNIASGFLVKKCETSNKNKDYYNKELTVTCTFYIPDSILKSNGDVEYKAGTGNSVSNMYYTPTNIGNNYNYKIEAKIVGMNRITDASSKADGEKGKSWTGTWSSTISNCNVILYPLLYSNNNGSSNGKNKYNFIYRPIDIYNPFPNRNAGINWFEWYSDTNNIERLEDSYSHLQYSIEMNNKVITKIKNYNKNQGSYFDWDTMRNGKSDFIDSYFQIKRENIVGDNS